MGNIQAPTQILAQLPLHLLDILDGVSVLADDEPRLVRVRLGAWGELRAEHEAGEEESVAGVHSGGGVAHFEALEEDEGSEGDEGR